MERKQAFVVLCTLIDVSFLVVMKNVVVKKRKKRVVILAFVRHRHMHGTSCCSFLANVERYFSTSTKNRGQNEY
jgi:hypothetical protein